MSQSFVGGADQKMLFWLANLTPPTDVEHANADSARSMNPSGLMNYRSAELSTQPKYQFWQRF